MEELFSTAQRRGVREKEPQPIEKNGKIIKEDVSHFQMSLQVFLRLLEVCCCSFCLCMGFGLLGIWAIEGVGSRSSIDICRKTEVRLQLDE